MYVCYSNDFHCKHAFFRHVCECVCVPTHMHAYMRFKLTKFLFYFFSVFN